MLSIRLLHGWTSTRSAVGWMRPDLSGKYFFIIYFIPDFIILRFFMYLIDMRNHAKEKNLRMLLGWLLMFWRKKINFGHLCFSDPACVERTKYCKTLTKIVLYATNPIEKLSRRNNRSNLLKCLRMDPFLVLIVVRTTNSSVLSKNILRRTTQYWMLLCSNAKLVVKHLRQNARRLGIWSHIDSFPRPPTNVI